MRVVIVVDDAEGPDIIDVKVEPANLMLPEAGQSPAIQAGRAVAGLAVRAKLLLAAGAVVGHEAAVTAREKLFEGK